MNVYFVLLIWETKNTHTNKTLYHLCFHIQIKYHFFHSLGFSWSLQSQQTTLLQTLLFCIIVISNFCFFQEILIHQFLGDRRYILFFLMICTTFSTVQPHHGTFECMSHWTKSVQSDPCPGHLQFVSTALPRTPCDSLWISRAVSQLLL